MDKFLKNIQWLIVAYASYNLYSIYEEYDPKPDIARAQTEQIRAKLAKNKKIKKEIDDFYKNIKEAEQKIEKVKESVEATQRLLPSEISDTENVALLRQTGEELNIKTMSITPGPEVVNGVFITKQYSFSAQATYVQFVVFFERIANNARILNIKNLKLKKTNGLRSAKIQFLSGSFVLEAYRYNPNYKDPELESATAPKTGGG